MSKLKKQIKKLRKEIKQEQCILTKVKESRVQLFEKLCTARGKIYYRENPLHPKTEDKVINGPIAIDRINACIAAFENISTRNITLMENKMRELDASIARKEKLIDSKIEQLNELVEL